MKIKCKMFEESSASESPKNIFAILGIFIAVFLTAAFLESVVPTVIMMPALIERLQAEGFKGKITINSEYMDRVMKLSREIMSNPKYFSIILICNIFMIISPIIYCRFAEKRSLSSMGFRKKKSAVHYLTGLFAGTFMMTADVLVSLAFGAYDIGLFAGTSVKFIIIFFIGFLIQGMAEEVMFRGYLMNTIGGKVSALSAILISAAAFSLAHAANNGVNPLVFFNIALFGVFAGLYMIAYDDIWGACAIHSTWNFFQGNFYGIQVSGTDVSNSVFTLSQKSDNTILTGGAFGIEGSISTTIILFIASAVMIIKLFRDGKILR